MIHHKINPSPFERWIKEAYMRWLAFWHENGLVIVLLLNLVWLSLFWRDLMKVG